MSTTRPLVKICGLTRNQDARFASDAGADYVGFVLSQGFGRSVPAGHGVQVARDVTARRVAVTVDESVKANTALARGISASVIQLHGHEEPEIGRALREAGDWSVWKAVRARSADDVRRTIEEFGEAIDGLLVEGWREDAIGGAGLTLDLDPGELGALIPPSLTFVLAGGLTPATVADFTVRFDPDVVDVSSGVERERGVKDPARVEAFIHAAREATVLGRTDHKIEDTRDHDH